ncbi:MAG: DUF2157 domain-containing protein [Alphaproteobacteria bacterium]|nr:DUF2157 domain-containing protein [Alphaproteobacteria bacterium]
MNDDAYRRRLAQDLERWSAAGWLDAETRARITAELPAPAARLSAATALGFAGAGLLGVAVVAFVMANWDGLPRFGRLGLIAALLAASIGGAVWADGRRPQTQGALLFVATLVFAAGIGLVGQMYNIPGAPWGVYAITAVAGLALAYAGEKAAPGVLGAGFAALAYVSREGHGPGFDVSDAGLVFAFVAFAGLALLQRKKVLIHTAIWFAGFTLFALLARALDGLKDGMAWAALTASLAWAAAAAWGRFAPRPGARTLYGYGVWFALVAFWVWGYAGDLGLAHRAAAIAIGLGLLALGRIDRHGFVLAAGIIGLLAGVAAALADLGLDLMVAAGLFFVLALGALIGAVALARRPAASRPGGAS